MTSELPETTAEEVYMIIMHINLFKIFVVGCLHSTTLKKQTAQIIRQNQYV